MFYFEDFPIGERRELGTRTVTEDEIVRFARDFDPQVFHVDKAAAEASFFGGIIASGWHTCSIAMRLICDGFLLDSASLGSPGVDEIRWKKPVRPGDSLTLFGTTTIAKPSTSKPDRGVLTNAMELVNQHGDVVMTMKAMTMIGRRPAA
jgi:acyl dehydratase